MSSLKKTEISQVVKNAWEAGKEINLDGIGYGRIHWGNRTDIKDNPPPYYFFLAGLVRRYGFKRILEIGTHWGGATRAMATGVRAGLDAQIVTVDITTESDGKLDAFPQIRKIVGDANSEKTFDEILDAFGSAPIDLVYIDAAHLTAPTLASFSLYSAALKPKLIVFDDITLNDKMKEAWRLISASLPSTAYINAAEVIREIRPTGDGFGVVRPPRPENTVFVHINKCGGSAVKQSIKDRNPSARICDFVFSEEYRSYGYERASEDYDVFMSHIGFDEAQRLGGRLVTVLRNPIERLISLYNFQHYRTPDHDPGDVFKDVAEMSFHEFLESDDKRIVVSRQNTMTYQLAKSHMFPQRSELSDLSDEEVLQLALDNLKTFDAVGILEKPSTLVPIIGSDPMDIVNNTKRGYFPDLRDERTRSLVFSSIYLDIQLYMKAVAMSEG
ncbi:class I SAM-dependent methyltransferase [Breoghania sp.]|uniref:class I SAM-dependent methyltransferase n=1 Tax=Breoghania sp. TaxID=2065378 RepID=UPI0029CA780B|nr:class I SAM-dependent methyltransferase [Breoghania sp.]